MYNHSCDHRQGELPPFCPPPLPYTTSFLLACCLSLPPTLSPTRGPVPALPLTPMFANHFFSCQQVNCFVLPFPAFITLCKLSDMSSTGASHGSRCRHAKSMRFGIINEDKLAPALLLLCADSLSLFA